MRGGNYEGRMMKRVVGTLAAMGLNLISLGSSVLVSGLASIWWEVCGDAYACFGFQRLKVSNLLASINFNSKHYFYSHA